MSSVNKTQVFIGVIGLFIGLLIYLTDRPPDSAYFIYATSTRISLYGVLPHLFGAFGSSLPALVHVFSFSLITAGLLSCKKKGCFIVCLAWFIIDFVFELGQKFDVQSARIVPDLFAGIPFLQNTKNFFLQGTFDPLDFVAMAIGGMTAYLVILATTERRYAS